jgi:hypothetical protein
VSNIIHKYSPIRCCITHIDEDMSLNKTRPVIVNIFSDWATKFFQVSLHSMHKYLPQVHILQTTDYRPGDATRAPSVCGTCPHIRVSRNNVHHSNGLSESASTESENITKSLK